METLHEKFFTQHPVDLFQLWLSDARVSEINDPEAMALATVNAQGQPSVRMVLLKEATQAGFCFYTNTQSRKGDDLAANPVAALCVHWKSLQRQVRVEGRVERLPDEMAQSYYATRHPLSQLGAWASAQSRPLASREELEGRVAQYREEFAEEKIPKPPYWGGYRVMPDKIEFWQAGEGRLHDRFLCTRAGDDWRVQRLNP